MRIPRIRAAATSVMVTEPKLTLRPPIPVISITEAVKRFATAYLKLLFPNVRKPGDISSDDFKRYCLDRARKMRDTIKYQLGLLDDEYKGKDIPAFTVCRDYDVVNNG